MGNWNLTIKGIGAHHNHNPGDVDKLAKQFVIELRKHQTVEEAILSYTAQTVVKEHL